MFATVVLALSVVLINGYGPGSGPALISYGAFCGGAAIVFAAVGVLAVFFDRLQGIIMLALDGLAAFFLVAGGIVSHLAAICFTDYAYNVLSGFCREHQDWRLQGPGIHLQAPVYFLSELYQNIPNNI